MSLLRKYIEHVILLEKKYAKRQRIVNRESYSTMIEFHNDEHDLFLPLGSKMMERIFGDLKQNIKGYHITNLNGVYSLLDIRGSAKQISAFTQGANADFIRDGITGRGGVVVEVFGRQIASGMQDMFTLPEKGGTRNITMEYITRLIRDPSVTDPMKKDLLLSIDEWLEKNEPEAGTGLDAWREVVRKRDKTQLHSMVKHYLDSAEKVMMKYADTLKENVYDSLKLGSKSYHQLKMYDEVVLDKIQVKNIYIWKKYYQRRGMPNYPSDEEFKQFIQDMDDEGVDVYTATAKEIINAVDG